jgi:hypothetical protein
MNIRFFLPGSYRGYLRKAAVLLILGIGGFVLGRIAGVITGLVLGYFLDELWAQLRYDRTVLAYFENPGPYHFYEEESGLAAFCALGVFLVSKAQPKALGDDAAVVRIAGGAASVFPKGRKIESQAEAFCRLAMRRVSLLNPDLLTESLAARRRGAGDLSLLGSELAAMALGREARREALSIRQFLDPSYVPPSDYIAEDPRKLLGVPPDASREEIKSAFRRLALMFHPDNQSGMGEEERKKAGDTFMKIQDAYRELLKEGE